MPAYADRDGTRLLTWRTGATQAWPLLASVADSTDVYAFVSPDRPDTVTLIANYIPLQEAADGPNFYEFGDDVPHGIHAGNSGDGDADISYQFRFVTKLTTPSSFPYNTGPGCPVMTAL